ncbi:MULTISPECIES: carbohydrate ABC transporter permease [unclassified Paenibacillus]|uniref:carbohydrate ABC transporter permease n=1 Tax=unclassified Paenibacillus TaxID=185978 RepID=UPI0024055CEF|nr:MULTISPECIES: carbohydrate ABC transporter permease [unclassified Paenibacillus]MDF9843648.1 putative aldouronate transport system permease protein [Paenibacillus sp. PastF-2]MDF9850236.1 putative aldouronate transport system permease protein [Paenibacillus sp. PastM-2]MDF9856824.1 putative aldouronate transport system permease protein [Paenibacillus sp. PastF-1]MDH6482083.1 putative aldouronate transport system permease protein [Paenibacillus sp. PastH-2]MDH6509506.1 putative aldouronate t
MIQTRGERTFTVFSAAVMLLLTVFAFVPFLLIVIASITDETALVRNGYSFFPEHLSLDAYRYIRASAYVFVRAYGVSFLVTLLGTAAGLLITSMLAYPMSRSDFKYHNVLAFVVFFTMLFSGGIVPSYIMWTQYFHIKNTLLALILPNLLSNGFNVLLVRNYFKNNVPLEIIEAAQIDGASELRTFFRIMLPLSMPVMATVGMFMGLAYWNDWINALYFVSKPQLYGIQNLLMQLMTNIQFLNSGQAGSVLGAATVQLPSTAVRMAMAVLGIVPVLFVLPFMQKYLTRGVVIGAVKG